MHNDPTKHALQMKKNIHKQENAKLKSTRCINVTHIKCISNTIAISLQLLHLTKHQVLAEHIPEFTFVHNGTVVRAAQLREKTLHKITLFLAGFQYAIKGLQLRSKQNYRSSSAPPRSIFFSVLQYEGQTDFF